MFMDIVFFDFGIRYYITTIAGKLTQLLKWPQTSLVYILNMVISHNFFKLTEGTPIAGWFITGKKLYQNG